MQSEAVEKCVQSAVLSVIAEHPMGHWRDDQVKEVARRAIAEAALSTDAEPVALYRSNENGNSWLQWLKSPDGYADGTALYAGPVKTAPAVAVKARKPKLPPIGNELYEFYPSMSSQTHADAVKDYARAAVSAALSAQVQDVVIPEGTDDEQ